LESGLVCWLTMLWKFLVCYCYKIFIDQFVFIWGREQCLMTSGQLTTKNYYCFKDLSCVYYTCWRLPYGKEDQTLLINDEWRAPKFLVWPKEGPKSWICGIG
jgi:hypothetical protein